MTRIDRRQALGLLGAAAGAAAASGLAAPAIAANRKVKIGALRFTSHSGTFAAYEKGHFAAQGLDVELTFFQAAQPMAIAIASGDVDFGVTAVTGGLLSLADKGVVKVIGGALAEEKGIDGQKILASNAAYEAGLTSPAALGGRTYGTTTPGSSFHYMGSKIAAAEGAAVKFKPLNKVGAVIGALKTGQIDAWSIVPHIAKPLAGAGAVKIIGNVSDYLPDYQVTTVFTSARHAADDAGLVKDFLSAYAAGVDDYAAAMIDRAGGDAGVEAMVDLIHKYVYADRERARAAKSIINGTMRLNAGAALNLASVKDQVDWFKAEGLAPAGLSMDKLVDARFVKTMG